jgi:hypothetical protein
LSWGVDEFYIRRCWYYHHPFSSVLCKHCSSAVQVTHNFTNHLLHGFLWCWLQLWKWVLSNPTGSSHLIFEGWERWCIVCCYLSFSRKVSREQKMVLFFMPYVVQCLLLSFLLMKVKCPPISAHKHRHSNKTTVHQETFIYEISAEEFL